MALTAQLSITALPALTGAAGIKLACKFAPQGTTFDNLLRERYAVLFDT